MNKLFESLKTDCDTFGFFKGFVDWRDLRGKSVTSSMNTLTLSELKLLIEQAIAKHGGDKKIKLFDCDGKEVYAGKIVEFHSDRGVWLEIK